MKKSFVLALALVIWTGLLVTSVFGAGTVTVTTKNLDNGKMQMVQIAWVADASDGSVPATTLTGQQMSSLTGAYLCGGETIPGSGAAAPTALYDVTVKTVGGTDTFGGTLGNRSASASEYAVPSLSSGVYGCWFVTEALTFNLTGNSVNSATGTLKLFFFRP